MKTLRIGLDLDDTIFSFMTSYKKRFKSYPKYDWVITRNVNNILIKEKSFWTNLPVMRRPDFTPILYCSSRVNPKSWSIQAIKVNNLPNSPLYQIPGYKLSKANVLRNKVDVFIDDSIHNFIDLNLKGIPCLLIDSDFNQDWKLGGRIYSLKYDEILKEYSNLINNILLNFKDYINDQITTII